MQTICCPRVLTARQIASHREGKTRAQRSTCSFLLGSFWRSRGGRCCKHKHKHKHKQRHFQFSFLFATLPKHNFQTCRLHRRLLFCPFHHSHRTAKATAPCWLYSSPCCSPPPPSRYPPSRPREQSSSLRTVRHQNAHNTARTSLHPHYPMMRHYHVLGEYS